MQRYINDFYYNDYHMIGNKGSHAKKSLQIRSRHKSTLSSPTVINNYYLHTNFCLFSKLMTIGYYSKIRNIEIKFQVNLWGKTFIPNKGFCFLYSIIQRLVEKVDFYHMIIYHMAITIRLILLCNARFEVLTERKLRKFYASHQE